MSKPVGMLIAAAALLLASCGSQPERATGPIVPGGAGGLSAPTVNAEVPQAPTTTAPQRIRSQPDCKAYSAFSFGHGVLAFATLEQHDELLAKFETLADAYLAKSDQFAAQVAVVREIAKTPAVEQTPEQGEELNEAFAPMTEWFTETCILEPGEADVPLTTTTTAGTGGP